MWGAFLLQDHIFRFGRFLDTDRLADGAVLGAAEMTGTGLFTGHFVDNIGRFQLECFEKRFIGPGDGAFTIDDKAGLHNEVET